MDISNQEMDILVFIVNADKGIRVIEYARETGILGGTVLLGEGTVRSGLLRALGLDSSHKEIVILIAPSQVAEETIDYVSEKKELFKKNKGIAFRTPLNKVIGITDKQIENSQEVDSKADPDKLPKGAEENMYQALITIVNRGEAHDVMRVAEEHGATGGTIIKARGAGSYEATEIFKIQIEPEKELLLIILENEHVSDVTDAISDYLNINQDNAGIIFSVGIEETRGLYN